MAVAKSWAYRSEHGPDRVSAETISKERAQYGGRPTGDIYFSTHKPPKRKRMKHVQKNGTSFFSYINGSDEIGGDGGESLTHRLFKEAIASICKTELRLGKRGDHVVTITHGEVEKEIATNAGSYYADAYWLFESKTYLNAKWSGELYIEVNKSHLVPTEKLQELRRLRLPVIEVDVRELFEYPYSDQQTTDQRETAHVEKIKRILEGGFLMGKVISDPSSVEFLEQQLALAQRELADTRQQTQAVKQLLEDTTARETKLQKQVNELNHSQKEQNTRKQELASDITKHEKEIKQLKAEISVKNTTINGLKYKLFHTKLALGIPLIGFAGLALHKAVLAILH